MIERTTWPDKLTIWADGSLSALLDYLRAELNARWAEELNVADMLTALMQVTLQAVDAGMVDVVARELRGLPAPRVAPLGAGRQVWVAGRNAAGLAWLHSWLWSEVRREPTRADVLRLVAQVGGGALAAGLIAQPRGPLVTLLPAPGTTRS